MLPARLLPAFGAIWFALACGPAPEVPTVDAGPIDGATAADSGALVDAGMIHDASVTPDAGPPALPDAGPPSVSIAEYCHQYAQRRCQGNVSCCGDGTMRYPSVDACLSGSDAEAQCVAGFDGVAFRTGLASYDPIAAAAFLPFLDDRIAGCMPLFQSDDPLVTVGTLGSGADCMGSGTDYSMALACAPGLVCAFESFSPVREACATTVGNGQACPSYNCASGLLCNVEAGGQFCRPYTADTAYCLYIPPA